MGVVWGRWVGVGQVGGCGVGGWVWGRWVGGCGVGCGMMLHFSMSNWNVYFHFTLGKKPYRKQW